MFTGLVEEVGEIIAITEDTDSARLDNVRYKRFRISCRKIHSDMTLGDSICVNGVCQTVVKKSFRFGPVSYKNAWFEVESWAATLAKTTFGALVVGDKVNLERALALNTRLGGHLTNGHVETALEIAKIETADKNVFVHVSIPEQYMENIIKEGSISLDGVSLTIADIDNTKNSIMLNIIAHTFHNTTIQYWRKADKVNVEFDFMYNYVKNVAFNYIVSLHSTSTRN